MTYASLLRSIRAEIERQRLYDGVQVVSLNKSTEDTIRTRYGAKIIEQIEETSGVKFESSEYIPDGKMLFFKPDTEPKDKGRRHQGVTFRGNADLTPSPLEGSQGNGSNPQNLNL